MNLLDLVALDDCCELIDPVLTSDLVCTCVVG